MGAPFLTLVADAGQRVDAAPASTFHLDTGSDARAVAFMQTLQVALRQAERLMERPEDQSADLRRLCATLLDSTADMVSPGEDAEWRIEPFVGA